MLCLCSFLACEGFIVRHRLLKDHQQWHCRYHFLFFFFSFSFCFSCPFFTFSFFYLIYYHSLNQRINLKNHLQQQSYFINHYPHFRYQIMINHFHFHRYHEPISFSCCRTLILIFSFMMIPLCKIIIYNNFEIEHLKIEWSRRAWLSLCFNIFLFYLFFFFNLFDFSCPLVSYIDILIIIWSFDHFSMH